MLDAVVLPVLEHPEGDLVIMEWMLIKSIPFNVIKEKPSNKSLEGFFIGEGLNIVASLFWDGFKNNKKESKMMKRRELKFDQNACFSIFNL